MPPQEHPRHGRRDLAELNDELLVAPDTEGVSVMLFPVTHVAR